MLPSFFLDLTDLTMFETKLAYMSPFCDVPEFDLTSSYPFRCPVYKLKKIAIRMIGGLA